LPRGHPAVENARSLNRFGNPQIIRRDEMGNPMYRNLDKLSRLMAPYTYRVTKDECLDLPPKIFQSMPFELSAAQMALYRRVADEMRYLRDDGQLDIYTALTIIGKLRQITSGFIMVEGLVTELLEAGPRMAALEEVLKDVEGQVIIWATYKEELRQIAAMLGSRCVEYHGSIGTTQRDEAIDRFQRGEVQYFVANPAAGGVGLTLTAARTVVYYSCDFNMDHRLQSEDRCHRIGTKHPVLYIDLAAVDTIDERIASSLQNKEATALQILDAL
jgi:SNF2 family DNA or RNA helicase